MHLISSELFEFLKVAGYNVSPGELGENITTAGLDLEQLPLGTLLRLGSTEAVELTGLRTPCVLIDRFRAGLKRPAVFSDKSGGSPLRCGMLGVLKTPGPVAAGDPARVMLPDEARRALPPL